MSGKGRLKSDHQINSSASTISLGEEGNDREYFRSLKTTSAKNIRTMKEKFMKTPRKPILFGEIFFPICLVKLLSLISNKKQPNIMKN